MTDPDLLDNQLSNLGKYRLSNLSKYKFRGSSRMAVRTVDVGIEVLASIYKSLESLNLNLGLGANIFKQVTHRVTT